MKNVFAGIIITGIVLIAGLSSAQAQGRVIVRKRCGAPPVAVVAVRSAPVVVARPIVVYPRRRKVVYVKHRYVPAPTRYVVVR